MCGSIVLAGSLASAAFSAPDAQGIEVALEYVRYPDVEDSDSPFNHRGDLTLECLAEPTAGDWKLPEIIGADPAFALAELGGSPRLFVLDRTVAGAPFYDRLRFDTDGDGDLTDEQPIGETDGLGIPGFFQPDAVDLTLDIDGHEQPYSLKVSVLHEEISIGEEVEKIDVEELVLTVGGNCGLSGSFELGGKSHQLLLAEDQINGRFDDVFSLAPGVVQQPHRAFEATGDLLFLTDEEKLDEYDISIVGTKLALGGELYDLAIDTKRGVLTLTPGVAATATVKLPPGVARLFLSSEDSTEYLVLYRPGREPRVPPGEYRLAGYQVYREDPQGDLWYLSATATPRSPVQAVAANKSVEFPMGEPYVPEAIVPPEAYEKLAGKKPDRVEVEFSISGVGQEIVNDLQHVAGGNTEIELDATGKHPAEPRYRIVTTKGKVVSQGGFEYG